MITFEEYKNQLKKSEIKEKPDVSRINKELTRFLASLYKTTMINELPDTVHLKLDFVLFGLIDNINPLFNAEDKIYKRFIYNIGMRNKTNLDIIPLFVYVKYFINDDIQYEMKYLRKIYIDGIYHYEEEFYKSPVLTFDKNVEVENEHTDN